MPLSLASLLTGIVQSVGTAWGLFQHYWVLFKLLITVFASVVLFMYMETFRFMVGVAENASADLTVVRNISPALHSALALLMLLVATMLAVYKPRGITPYGRRKQHEKRTGAGPDGESIPTTPRWVKVFGTVALVVVLMVVVLLFIGGRHGPPRHTTSHENVSTADVISLPTGAHRSERNSQLTPKAAATVTSLPAGPPSPRGRHEQPRPRFSTSLDAPSQPSSRKSSSGFLLIQ